MPDFGTFIIVDPDVARSLSGFKVEGKWEVRTRPDPSWRFKITRDRRGRTETTKSTPLRGDEELCHELIISCADSDVADAVRSLVHAGVLLTYPDVLNAPITPGAYDLGAFSEERLREPTLSSWFQFYREGGFGILIASRAYGDAALTYALEKYRLSIELDSFTPHSASPIYGQVFPEAYPDTRYHTKAAYAIVTAYSVIEELGLEVRSSPQKPIYLASDEWNPEVRDDVLDRLTRIGADPDELFTWVRRGSETPLERDEPIRGTPTEYYDGIVVRDVYARIEDALQRARYLRNFIMAHKFKDLTSWVSPYEVFNVQSLSRRLLLIRLGIWKLLTDTANVDWDAVLDSA